MAVSHADPVLLVYLSYDTEKILHMFYYPKAIPMYELPPQADAFPRQFPKPKSISLQNLSDGGK